MDNISVSSFLCIFSLLIGLISLLENDLFNRNQTRKMMILASIIILEIFLDTICFNVLNGNTKLIFLYKVLKALEFTLTPIIPLLISHLIVRKRFWKKVRNIFAIMITVNTLCELITLFYPLMFYINQQGKYNRTLYTDVYILFIVICFSLSMFCSHKTFIQNKYISFTLLAINIFLLTGWIIRAISTNTNADWICITIGYFLFIIDYSNSYLKIDSLTSLLNRRSFDNKISSNRHTTAIIIIDANNFKKINDSFGHQCGDWALATIAEAIYNVYGDVGYCYRIGGDEFCVIFKPGMLKKLTSIDPNMDTYKTINKLINELDCKLKEIGKNKKALSYGVSQGFGIYYSINDNSDFDQHKTMREVFKLADKRLYQKKQQIHKE